MSERADETGGGAQDSPYRPPPLVAEDRDELPSRAELRPAIPVFLVGLYAFIATGLTFVAIFAVGTLSSGDFVFLTVVGTPVIFLGLFTWLAISAAASSIPPTTAVKSLTWKIAMVAFSAPAAMVVFVPTCMATTLSLVAVTGFGFGGEGIFVFTGAFTAYFVTCYLLALWVRKRVSSRKMRHNDFDS